MDEKQFPPNTRTQKEEKPEKVIEPVVTTGIKRRKKPLGKKFLETFIAGERDSVATYLVRDLIIPAVKDIVADVVTQAVERTLFGESRSTIRRPGFRPGSSAPTQGSFQRYISPASRDRAPAPRPRRGKFDFDEIILATRTEAETVIDRLFDLVARYDAATVGDLYELVGMSGSYTDQNWGWTDMRGSGVTRINSGYLLDLPKPEPLDS